MTTHDHPTLTGSHEESQTLVEESPQVSEPTAASDPSAAPVEPSTASADSSTAPVDPSPPSLAVDDDPNQSPSPVAPADPSTSGAARESSSEQMLFADDELADLRGRWAGVQAAFVDDPKDCVQKADVLVSDLVDQLTDGFARARSRLEEQWARGEQASTEDLRLTLMHYREFFERLLAV